MCKFKYQEGSENLMQIRFHRCCISTQKRRDVNAAEDL